MPTIRCKMCGGIIQAKENVNTAVCEFCGIEQTVPLITDERRLMLFNRANVQRIKNEYDAAINTYQALLIDNPNDPEAHFGIVLCKYGIEYVDDPKMGKKVPTCHRTTYDSIYDDLDYKIAVEYADVVSRELYKKQAAEIDEIQKGILSISHKEEPYDIFICYKETDFNGNRTSDSVYAYDIYEELTNKGYRVFFSRVTLESMVGQLYEPIIFAALNSAKVMIVVGTKAEYFNAPWVKNEWSRFISFMGNDKNKFLIPCYKDITPYEMPEEFKYLQAQDMSKIGYMQDLVRGIEKLINKRNVVEINEAPKSDDSVQRAIVPIVKKVRMLIGEKSYKICYSLIDEILFYDPENPDAYIFKLLIQKNLTDENQLGLLEKIYLNDYFNKALRYAKGEQKRRLQDLKEKALETQYQRFLDLLKAGKKEMLYKMVDSGLREYKDVGKIVDGLKENYEKVSELREIVEEYLRKLIIYKFEDETLIAYKQDNDIYVTNREDINKELMNLYNINEIKFYKHQKDIKWIATFDDESVKLSKGMSLPNMSNENLRSPIGLEKYSNSIIYKKFDAKYIPSDDIIVDGRKVSSSQYDNYLFGFRKIKKIIVEDGHSFAITNSNKLLSSSMDKFNIGDTHNVIDVCYSNDTLYVLLEGGGVLVQHNGSNSYDRYQKNGIVYIGKNYNRSLKGNHHAIDCNGNVYILETGEKLELENVLIILEGLYITLDGYIKVIDNSRFGNLHDVEITDSESIKKFLNANEHVMSEELQIENRKRNNLCCYCGGKFKGLFTKKCVDCGKKKNY